MTEPTTAVSAAVYALAALYVLLTVGYVWVRVHCPVAHRRGDKRAYLRHCWRVWCTCRCAAAWPQARHATR